MKRRRITYWIISLLVLGVVTIWFSSGLVRMKKIEPYAVKDPGLSERLLIASQGSEFKAAVVEELITGLEPLPVFIQVIDVGGLEKIEEADWSVIVIIHTVEYWKPPKQVQLFLDRMENKHKVIVLSTSREGYELEEIDGISSASNLTEAKDKADEIVARITSHIMTNDLAKQNK